MTRIYLDNAATSFPKPESVYRAVDRYQRELGVAVGRGATQIASEVQATVRRCRSGIAKLFNASAADHVVFTLNGTDSLNLVLHGLLTAGDHVVTSQLEHNSVLRPLAWLAEHRGVEFNVVPPNERGVVTVDALRDACRPHTKLVALIHASNVTGAIQPLAAVSEFCAERKLLFLLDAAQTAGAVPIDLASTPVDFLACPGHKGLLGPLGTGVLYIRPGIAEQLNSVRQGGTGSQSELDSQPTTLPDKFEAGNHNAPGLFGLAAGVDYVTEQSVSAIQQHEQQRTAEFLDRVQAMDGVTMYGPSADQPRIGVVSLNIDGWDPQDVASILDDTFQIQTRAGLHCAPGVHRGLGTLATGGTVRFSVGAFTTSDDINAAATALAEIVQGG